MSRFLTTVTSIDSCLPKHTHTHTLSLTFIYTHTNPKENLRFYSQHTKTQNKTFVSTIYIHKHKTHCAVCMLAMVTRVSVTRTELESLTVLYCILYFVYVRWQLWLELLWLCWWANVDYIMWREFYDAGWKEGKNEDGREYYTCMFT